VLPAGGSAFVGAQRHSPVECEERVRDPTEQEHGEHALRVGLDPGPVVLGEGGAERMEGVLNAPVECGRGAAIAAA